MQCETAEVNETPLAINKKPLLIEGLFFLITLLFFIDQLPNFDELRDGSFTKELAAVGNKIEHYLRKGEQRKKEFLEVYEPICERSKLSPNNFSPSESCEESFKLAYTYFLAVKTLWKMEQHIILLLLSYLLKIKRVILLNILVFEKILQKL